MTSYFHGEECDLELSTSNDSGLSPFEPDETVTQFTINLNEICLTQQPRRYFDKEAMVALVESIKQHGILQPLLVRPVAPGEYELVAGERRYRAAQAAGLTEVPVTVRHMSDLEAVEYALIENLQREDINPVEETEGILQLLAQSLGQTKSEIVSLLHRMENSAKGKITRNVSGNSEVVFVEQLFASLGRMNWQSFVRTRLPLLNLPEDVLKVLRSGKIAYTKAKAIARVKEQQTRVSLLERAITNNWSLSEIQQQIVALIPTEEPTPLKQQFETTYARAKKAQIWSDPNKKARLESLLKELESLVG